MNLWRIHLKPSGKSAAQFCFDGRYVGIGWGLDSPPISQQDYLQRASAKADADKNWAKGWKAAAGAILHGMQENDLVWARDKMGKYYLGRVCGGWLSLDNEESKAADVRNVRQCEWIAIGSQDAVPGAVVNSFRPTRTVQKVKDPSSVVYSQLVFNRQTGRKLYEVDSTADILQLLSDADLEDVIGIFLQAVKGCVLYPSTCKRDTMVLEFEWCQADGTRGGVQVKSGSERLDQDNYAALGIHVYLFAASGRYIGTKSQNVTCLQPDDIRAFIIANRTVMPRRIQLWMDHCQQVQTVEL